MDTLLLLLGLVLLLSLCYVFVLHGRRGHKDLPSLRGWCYAHRGLHEEGVPENSLAAFRLALEKGYGIELDVHLMKDGTLAVIHDESLLRTAGADLRIEELTARDLAAHCLEGTREPIPTLPQVLELFAGKAPLIIELKSSRGNHAALCEGVMALLSRYSGAYCIESFDPRCVGYLRRKYPQVIRGQLARNFHRVKNNRPPWVICFGMTLLLSNIYTRPDFIAWRFQDRKHPVMRLCCGLLGLQGVTWTVRTAQELEDARAEGLIPIFEHFCP